MFIDFICDGLGFTKLHDRRITDGSLVVFVVCFAISWMKVDEIKLQGETYISRVQYFA